MTSVPLLSLESLLWPPTLNILLGQLPKHKLRICDKFHRSLVYWDNNLSHLIDFVLGIPSRITEIAPEVCISQPFDQQSVFDTRF